jgi:hypothetical protein
MHQRLASFGVGFIAVQLAARHFMRGTLVFFASFKIMLNAFHYFLPFFFIIFIGAFFVTLTGFFLELPYPIPFGILFLLTEFIRF